MEFIRVFISGIIGGFTCVSPISWEGHLKLSEFLYMDTAKPVSDSIFPLIVRLAVIISLTYFLKETIISLGKSVIEIVKDISSKSFKPENGKRNRNDLFMIIFASVLFVFFPLVSALFKGMAANLLTVAGCFIISGMFLYYVDTVKEKKLSEKNENPLNAFSVGIFNLFSVMPGLSGISGMYFAGILNRFTKEFSFKFTLILTLVYTVVSFIGGAAALFYKLTIGLNVIFYIFAFIGALFASYFAVKLFEIAVKKNHLKYYGFYNIILAIFIFFIWIRG